MEQVLGGEMESGAFRVELCAGNVSKGSALDPAEHEVINVRLVRPLAVTKEVHLHHMAQISVPLYVESLGRLPEVQTLPSSCLLMSSSSRSCGVGDDAHGYLFGLAPICELSCIERKCGSGLG